MKTIKVYEVSAYCGGNYSIWIPNVERVDSVKEADLVLFKGGEDVHPSFYNEEMHPLTHSNIQRDRYEKKIYEECVSLGKKMLGVCRGSQFLSVMNGGKLHQHIIGHGVTHPCYTIDKDGEEGEISQITSSHHQCLDLDSVKDREDFRVLGFWFEDKTAKLVPEFATFPNCLLIQSHPEYVCSEQGIIKGFEPYIEYCRNLLNELMNG